MHAKYRMYDELLRESFLQGLSAHCAAILGALDVWIQKCSKELHRIEHNQYATYCSRVRHALSQSIDFLSMIWLTQCLQVCGSLHLFSFVCE